MPVRDRPAVRPARSPSPHPTARAPTPHPVVRGRALIPAPQRAQARPPPPPAAIVAPPQHRFDIDFLRGCGDGDLRRVRVGWTDTEERLAVLRRDVPRVVQMHQLNVREALARLQYPIDSTPEEQRLLRAFTVANVITWTDDVHVDHRGQLIPQRYQPVVHQPVPGLPRPLPPPPGYQPPQNGYAGAPDGQRAPPPQYGSLYPVVDPTGHPLAAHRPRQRAPPQHLPVGGRAPSVVHGGASPSDESEDPANDPAGNAAAVSPRAAPAAAYAAPAAAPPAPPPQTGHPQVDAERSPSTVSHSIVPTVVSPSNQSSPHYPLSSFSNDPYRGYDTQSMNQSIEPLEEEENMGETDDSGLQDNTYAISGYRDDRTQISMDIDEDEEDERVECSSEQPYMKAVADFVEMQRREMETPDTRPIMPITKRPVLLPTPAVVPFVPHHPYQLLWRKQKRQQPPPFPKKP